MDDPAWKKLKLSLERPYKDDNGASIPDLYDITPDGKHLYEPKENLTKQLGQKLRRVFLERGVDFFEKGRVRSSSKTDTQGMEDVNPPALEEHLEEGSTDKSASSTMTTEDLLKMRMDILPHLHITLGEMSHARDLLSSLLATKPPSHNRILPAAEVAPPSSHISATVVNKPPPILSVQTFNAQLSIGGKDEALRKAADIFKAASGNMESARQQGEKYWLDALKIRRGNWRLVPAPLPFASSIAKGADKTAKDFLIVYGLEESPPFFRRQAIAHIATTADDADHLVFPHRQRTRLRVSIKSSDGGHFHYQSPSTCEPLDETDLGRGLQVAQQEIVEQETFSLLVKEAASLPTALVRVSERAMFIDAAPGLELQIELVNPETIATAMEEDPNSTSNTCHLIYHGLQILLLRQHSFLKTQRLGSIRESPGTSQVPPILQPIIDLLQYQVFCKRLKVELDKVIMSLMSVGIVSALRFTPVGESGRDLLECIDKGGKRLMSGEALLRVDDQYGIRLTFEAPSSLTAHLSQATIAITSLPQLSQLLMDEVERCLLQRICDTGKNLSESVGGTWFVDLDKSIGRWDGCALNFCIQYGDDHTIDCIAFRLDEVTGGHGRTQMYATDGNQIPLLEWVAGTIQAACEKRL